MNRGRILSNRVKYGEEISPMESMVNLVDVMLVFICGLLISIIIFWNVNMKNLVVILDQKQLVQVKNPKEVTKQIKASSSYGDVGIAVMDPKTGKFYVVNDKTGAVKKQRGHE